MPEHECVFVEEREPSGRLVLPPCIVCGTTAMDALNHLVRGGPETKPKCDCRGRADVRTPPGPASACPHYGHQDLSRCGICSGVDS